MEKTEEFKKGIKIGETGYINQNCWLAKNLGYSPSKRCQYCESKFSNCLFFRYLVITLILVLFILITSLLIRENVSRLVVISIFLLVIIYGFFFSKSTDDIIVANFAQRKAKEAFRELSKTLQQKVDEQTKEVRQAYEVEKKAHDELKKTDEVKSQFLVITNHHLRTPLTAINWYTDLLLSGKRGKMPAKSKEVIDMIKTSTAEEIKIVDDLLNVSQFQLGKDMVNPRPEVNIEEMLKQIKNSMDVEIQQKKTYIKIEKENNIPLISADEIKLKVAIANIIDNAVKYTEKGGITIKLKSETEGKNKKLIIAIQDTGIGMDETELKNIFTKTFQRGEEAQKLFATGKGIGLYLSAKIIEAHRGRVWAESAGKTKGSTFYIELPTE